MLVSCVFDIQPSWIAYITMIKAQSFDRSMVQVHSFSLSSRMVVHIFLFHG